MKTTKVKINKVYGEKGLVGFAEIVLDDCLYVGGIGIFSRLNEPNKIRLVFPTKKKNDKDIKICYPMTNDFYRFLEDIIQKNYEQCDGS